MQDRITRRPYLFWGSTLLLIKYFGELSLYYLAKGKVLTPLNFLSPLLQARYPDFSSLPDWFGPAIIIWSLPFIWIGVGMSIRRAADANLSPWLGILFFIPGLNYFLMLGLALAPTSKSAIWDARKINADHGKVMSPLMLTILFAFCGTLLTWFSTNLLRTYATSLFVGSPLILGLVLGYFLNCKSPLGFKKTTGYVGLTILLIHLLLLLFALEGIICLAMSLPISASLGIIGSIFGAGIASYAKPNVISPSILMLVLPIMPLAETTIMKPHQDVVLSTMEINAPPAQVWPNVVKFSDLPETTDWLFQLGVAYPVRARIEGRGVGAVRRCEFSTGAFVEPITVWNEPYQLGFDVRYQPQPMKELSFYDHVDAPHLNGYFRSIKGEFRLIPTQDGKTILEGRTWYEMDIQPGWYWQIYGRWFIHKIHLRVLAHIKHLSEGGNSL
jgi:uncharacterized membrane protein YhaH (DUF805 family)